MPVLFHLRSTCQRFHAHQTKSARPGFNGSAAAAMRPAPIAAKTSPSRRSSTPPCPGISPLEILHPKKALDEKFPKIAALGDECQHHAERCHCRDRRMPEPCGKKHARYACEKRSADESRPRFVWRNFRGELRAANQSSGKKGASICGPYDEKQVEDGVKSVVGVLPDRDQRDCRETGVVDARSRPPGITPVIQPLMEAKYQPCRDENDGDSGRRLMLQSEIDPRR